MPNTICQKVKTKKATLRPIQIHAFAAPQHSVKHVNIKVGICVTQTGGFEGGPREPLNGFGFPFTELHPVF